MNLYIEISKKKYQLLPTPIDISIPLNFNGLQPNSYGVSRASSSAFEGGGWVGDVRRGGSCNFEVYNLTPHCNGTHTECVGHITEARFSVHELLKDSLLPATLISVVPNKGETTQDSYPVALHADDKLIDVKALEEALQGTDTNFHKALIIRTLPNPIEKMYWDYTQIEPAFFSLEAMQLIRSLGVEHLLIDLPSVDRLLDEGKLGTHRIFWGLEVGGQHISGEIPTRTITEFIYVPNDIKDGYYVLNLQIAPFMSDASPSRPQLFGLVEAT